MNDNYILEIIDKSGRKIRLTKRQWKHILRRHSDMINYQDEIKETLKNPQKITNHPYDEKSRYYYSYVKHKQGHNKYLLVIVNYLNGDGFVITAYFRGNIKWK
jgi:hypothetical protein